MAGSAFSQNPIRCWGSAQMDVLLARWQTGYMHGHKDTRFENHMYGAVSAIGGLYAGAADLVLNREIWPVETMAFEQVMGYPPVAIEVATGSFDVPTKSDSLNIFVHGQNPIGGLTFAQLARIFSGRITSWSDLGIKGPLAPRQVRPYGYLADNAGSRLFQTLVMARGDRWSPLYREFGNAAQPGGGRIDAGQLILEALAKDPGGVAISNVHYLNPGVKLVAVSVGDGQPFVVPTRATVQARTYPLTRQVFVFVKRDASPEVLEFLRYVLSAEGQKEAALEGGYLPLPESVAKEQRKRLNP